eukprot:scaffold19173_cov72-Phaeocystis_antarctica.AAC.1
MIAAALEQLEVGRRLAVEHLDGHAHFPEGLLIAVGVALLGQLRLLEHAQHGELGADGLARAGGRADERALVRVVERRDDLRLDRVEVREGRRARPQRRDGQRTQVEQLRVRKETGSVVSAPSQLSETMRMKYCGGSGSQIGMVKVIV